MTPCSPLSSNRRFGGTYRLHLQGRRKVQQINEQAGGKWQDDTLHNHRRENLKSYNEFYYYYGSYKTIAL
jgi:hypothetical protein